MIPFDTNGCGDDGGNKQERWENDDYQVSGVI